MLLKIVANGVNKLKKFKENAVILITHYQRLLDYISPRLMFTFCTNGKIVKSGR